MSTIRRQSIISSFIVYIGFALGFFNTYLFTRQGGFPKEQYGIVTLFISIAQLMYAVAHVGMPGYIIKFFPYYKAHLPPKKNDLLTYGLLLPCIGFLVVIVLGLAFKGILINKIFANSPQLIEYYYWLFPFGFGFSLFMVLDTYLMLLHKAVLSNFLREVAFRFFVTVLILLITFNLITKFDTFVALYSFVYIVLLLYLVFYLNKKDLLHFTFKRSHVTRKFRKKILAMVTFTWSGGLIFSLAGVVDTIIIAAVMPNGVGEAAVFTFGQYITSLIQAPQRAVITSSIGPLSQAWRDKDFTRLNKIYHRSSINQLLFATAAFVLIWINFEDAIRTFHIQQDFFNAKIIFFYLGLTRIIDMGTGVNSQIIGTSTSWKFEFLTGIILLSLMLPLNYFLTKYIGLVGPAISNLISFAVYNAIRYGFLLRKFKMQPFDAKTVYTLMLAFACFAIAYYPFRNFSGLEWMIIRSLCFFVPFVAGTLLLKLSPDVMPVWQTVRKRLRLA